MPYLGIDIGSLSCDAVVIDDDGVVLGSSVVPTGSRTAIAIQRARREALDAAGLGEAAVTATVATGYGRHSVESALAPVTEITCHARGILGVLPDTRLLIDIGGQDSKAIRIGDDGRVMDFAMNDKCAAGTGRFLEAMARALEVDVDRLGVLSAAATSEVTLSSMCTVFAESEVVSRIAGGTPVEDIARGLHRAIATRTLGLAKRVAPRLDGLRVAMSGGVARNAGVVRALEEALGVPVHVPPDPDTVGALGAALIARDRTQA